MVCVKIEYRKGETQTAAMQLWRNYLDIRKDVKTPELAPDHKEITYLLVKAVRAETLQPASDGEVVAGSVFVQDDDGNVLFAAKNPTAMQMAKIRPLVLNYLQTHLAQAS